MDKYQKTAIDGAVNKEEGHLESETKESDVDDRKKGQLPDAEKAEDFPEGSKVYLLNNQLDRNDIKSLFSKSDDRLDHKELGTQEDIAN
ncbi:hypothetical protein E2562_014145 [Oryza meyeriana var. granulata]|uniref:Uncharacterized protein n=1 Tax=Oryza meyeriana var. granulata TaxID=110450 RepID=A0A6G1F8A6_9ORYZ|nr:hypothetical protein E2562_014145 [Oryza meyeriana var. granulata]